MQVKTIVGHSIWEFLNEVQEAVLEGYRLSEKSEYFPYTTGPLSVVHLVKLEWGDEGYEIVASPDKFDAFANQLDELCVKEENEHSEEEDSSIDEAPQEVQQEGGGTSFTSSISVEYSESDVPTEVEYNPDLVALADIVDIAEQSGAAIPPVEKKKPGRKAKA